MAITNDDVKLFEGQRLTDEADGGGLVTGREVIDGNANNLFQDISRIDRTVGDVALRKAFIAKKQAKSRGQKQGSTKKQGSGLES